MKKIYLIVATIVLLCAGGVAVAVGNNINRSANETAVSEETPPVMAEAVEVASINTTERTECEKVSEQKAADNKKSIVGQKVLKVEALSTGKARGTPGSCHHSKSPPDVSVHSRGTCFP